MTPTDTLATLPRPDPPHHVPREHAVSFWGFFRALRANPLAAWPARAYREPFVVFPGNRFLPDLVFVTDPSMVKAVHLDDARLYDKGDVVRRRLAAALGDALLIAPEASWRPQRRVIAPIFASRRVETFAPDMVAVARAVSTEIAGKAGAVFDAHEAMLGLAYGVIERTAFSSDGVTDPLAFSRAIARYFETVGRIDAASFLNLPAWVPTVDRLRARPALALFRREIGGVIARRRERIAREGLAAAPDDLLTRLIATPDPQTGERLPDALVHDNTMVFFAAGHETTANTLSWALLLLATHPEWDAAVADEIARVVGAGDPTIDDLGRLSLTRMVLDETLRLYPAAPFLPRMPMEDVDLGPLRLRAGSIVMTSPYVSQRHRAHWEAPDAFRPERFAPDKRDAIDRFVYFPFGAGPRICIGQAFAVQEILIALVELLRRHRFVAVAPEAVIPKAAVTLAPKGGLPLRAVPRA